MDLSLNNLERLICHKNPYQPTHQPYIYIYIVIHRQTFVLSELFSVARHAGRSKPKSIQLYVRLSFKPVGHQADYVG